MFYHSYLDKVIHWVVSLFIIFQNIQMLLQIVLLDTWMILIDGVGISRQTIAVLIRKVDWDWVE